jgi:hypothetical protein
VSRGVSGRLGAWLLASLAWSASASAAPVSREASEPELDGPRRLGIGELHAPARSDARGAVLEALSARSEVEIVGYEDVKMAGKQLGVDPASARGRKRISAELGVYAWIEGEVSARNEGRLRLVDVDGHTLATLRVSADDGSALEAAIRANLWSALGRFVSDSAAHDYALGQQQQRAAQKHTARLEELERQKALALEREVEQAQRLNDNRGLARKKQEARFAELQRQVEIVLARREEQARQLQLAADQAAREERERLAVLQRQQAEAARLAEAQRRQEEARLAALQRQQQLQQQQAQVIAWQPAPPQPAQTWSPAPSARTVSAAPPTGRFPRYQGATYQPPSRFADQPGAGAAASSGYAQSQADYGAPVSPETQRWLEARNAAR